LIVELEDLESHIVYKGKFPKRHSETLLDATVDDSYSEFLELMLIDKCDQIHAPFQPSPSPGRDSKNEI